VKRRLEAVNAEIAATTPKQLPVEIPEGAEALRAAWDGWSLEQRRSVVTFALKRVVVKPTGPGYRFDGRRGLQLDWRV